MKTFTFQKDQFSRLFPFYILLDESMVMQSCGQTIQKVFGQCEHNEFTDWFTLERPNTTTCTFEGLQKISNQVAVFRSTKRTDFVLRGQVEFLAEENHLLLLLTPWFDSVETVLKNNLTLDDFSLHDSTIDLLHVLKTHEITTSDMKELLIKVKEQKDELKQLSLIVEDSVNSILVTDDEGRVEWVNKAFFNITGYTLAEVKGKKPGQILQGKQTSKDTIQYLKNQIHHKQPFSCEILNYHKNGTPYWIRLSGQPLFNKDGVVTRFFGMQEDITKEKQANEKLTESENRLAALIVNLQTGILLENENREVLLANQKFCSMFGLDSSPDKLMGSLSALEEYKSLFKEEKRFTAHMEELVQNKVAKLGEELELKDGRVFKRNYTPIYVEGVYKGHLWSYDDITLNKNYQKSLQAQKEKYSSIIANMNLGLVEVNKNDEIVYANQSFINISGYTLEDLKGKKAAQLLLSKESLEVFKEHNIRRKKGISDSYEVKVKTKKGETRYWLISGAPNYDMNGNLMGSIGIHLDITEQKKLQKQKNKLLENLATQNEQLNEYAHIVSHDLKSPLRNISALLSWTKEDFKEKLGTESLMTLNLMQDKVEKMDYLIDNILKYSSIDKGQSEAIPLDLNALVNKIKDMIYVPGHISVTIVKPLPTIMADETRIQQLFQNLMSNAVNYSDKAEGRVEVDYTENATHYIFSVKDNGIGIAPEHHEKIFKVFSSLGNHEKSTGIGLSIVKKVVDFYKGKIWLESEPGVGTTFYFSLLKNKA